MELSHARAQSFEKHLTRAGSRPGVSCDSVELDLLHSCCGRRLYNWRRRVGSRRQSPRQKQNKRGKSPNLTRTRVAAGRRAFATIIISLLPLSGRQNRATLERASVAARRRLYVAAAPATLQRMAVTLECSLSLSLSLWSDFGRGACKCCPSSEFRISALGTRNETKELARARESESEGERLMAAVWRTIVERA